MQVTAERLRQARKDKALSQQELGDRVGVTRGVIANWESDNYEPSASTLRRVSEALDVTTDWLLGLVDTQEQNLMESDLAPAERQLVEMYRKGRLPPFIQQRLLKAAGLSAEPGEPAQDFQKEPQVARQ